MDNRREKETEINEKLTNTERHGCDAKEQEKKLAETERNLKKIDEEKGKLQEKGIDGQQKYVHRLAICTLILTGLLEDLLWLSLCFTPQLHQFAERLRDRKLVQSSPWQRLYQQC